MAYKYKDKNDNRIYIEEDYEGEIEEAFLKADVDYEKEVDVLYVTDSMTGEDIELWRKDWGVESNTNYLKEYKFTSCDDCVNKVDNNYTEPCLSCKRYYGCYFEKKRIKE